MGHLIETLLYYLSGAFYAAGLWIWIDAQVDSSIKNEDNGVDATWYHWIPLILGTVALIMINLPAHEQFGSSSVDDNVRRRVWAWLLFSFFLSFGSLALALGLAIKQWFIDENDNLWPGIALIISTVCVFIRFSRATEKQDGI